MATKNAMIARTGLAVAVMLGAGLVAGTASAQAISYTDVQATQGATAYGASCARCHGAQAQGAEAPSLTGAQFDGSWRGGPVKDLFDFISQYMPEDKPGILAKDVYVTIVAHLLKINGIPGGATALANPPPAGILIPK